MKNVIQTKLLGLSLILLSILIGVVNVGGGVLPAYSEEYGLVNGGALENTQWNLQDSVNGYNNVTVDMTPMVNTFPPDQAYFYGNTVWFNKYTGSNTGAAYAGLQTNGHDGTSAVGKMLIFSVWDAVKAEPVEGGTAVPFGGEGTGYSVRVPYDWQAGTSYRVRIGLLKTVGKNHVWEGSVTNLSTNAVQKLGNIYVPKTYGKIYGPVTFHERYLGNPTACDTISPSQVSFTNMTANNGSQVASAWSHYYTQTVPGCENYLWIQDLTNGYISSVGIFRP